MRSERQAKIARPSDVLRSRGLGVADRLAAPPLRPSGPIFSVQARCQRAHAPVADVRSIDGPDGDEPAGGARQENFRCRTKLCRTEIPLLDLEPEFSAKFQSRAPCH